MGKVKLRSPIKALHQALCNFKPTGPRTGTWVCIQQAKTHSFRDVYKSFNSMYSGSDICFINEETEQKLFVDIDFTSKSSNLSTDFCSSADTNDSSAETVLSGLITGLSSQRFFFSPCTTKSIMEEANPPLKDLEVCSGSERSKIDLGFVETKKIDLGFVETRILELSGIETGELSLKETQDEEIWFETGEIEETCSELDFCKGSVTMAMNSENPYLDFRVSMEEMVEAHDLREWSCLQDLLHCYLKLNERTTHRFIVGAFFDLLINLITKANNDREALPLCLQE